MELRLGAAEGEFAAVIGEFAAWGGHGCKATTFTDYANRVCKLFACEAVRLCAEYSVLPGSSPLEAIGQLKRTPAADPNGFLRAGLRKLLLFLSQREQGGAAAAAVPASGAASAAKEPAAASPVTAQQHMMQRWAAKRAPSASPLKSAASKRRRTASPKAAAEAASSPKLPDGWAEYTRTSRLHAVMLDLLSWASSQEHSWRWARPVLEAHGELPGYDERVARVMDMRTIRYALERGDYRAEDGVMRFREDVCLCFHNTMQYTPNPADPYFSAARQLLKGFEQRFAEKMSGVHAAGGGVVPDCDRYSAATASQRRMLRQAARRGGCGLLPYVSLSEYYSPELRWRAGFAMRKKSPAHLAGAFWSGAVPGTPALSAFWSGATRLESPVEPTVGPADVPGAGPLSGPGMHAPGGVVYEGCGAAFKRQCELGNHLKACCGQLVAKPKFIAAHRNSDPHADGFTPVATLLPPNPAPVPATSAVDEEQAGPAALESAQLALIEPESGALPCGAVRNSSVWTALDDDLLRAAVHKYAQRNWKAIAAEIGSDSFGANKTDVKCMHHWQTVRFYT